MTALDPNHALIVGDSPEGELLDRALEGAGFRITRIANPFETPLRLDESDANAVLVHVDRVEDADLDLFRVLRALRPTARIVAAFDRHRARAARALELGADAVLPEPFYIGECAALLRPGTARGVSPDRPTGAATAFDRDSEIGIETRNTPDEPVGEASSRSARESHTVEPSDLETALTSALEEFAGGVAHEINNPLTVISGWIEVLARESERDERSRSRLASMLEEARRIERVVGNLRAFGRVSTAPFSEVDVESAIHRAVRDFDSVKGSSPIEFALSIEPGLPRIAGDEAAIRELLAHLFRNAATAADGPAKIDVTVDRDAGPGGPWIRLVVRDYGPGISPAHQGRLFRPFFSGFAGENHAGLGLAACRGIVRRHSGTLEWLSEIRPGAAFRILLPVREAAGKGLPSDGDNP